MRWYLILFMLGVLNPLLMCNVGAAERTKPILIGVLTDSWGPTPGVVGLRDGLKEQVLPREPGFRDRGPIHPR
jgi:hypothetical protein